jgi:hypothetical protein
MGVGACQVFFGDIIMARTKRPKLDVLKDIDPGFNNLNIWLRQKLNERQLSVNHFSALSGGKIDTAVVWSWYADRTRPYPRTMQIVCETLSRAPIIFENGDEYLEHIPWSEGLAQYSPRPRAWAAHYVNNPTQTGRSKSKNN